MARRQPHALRRHQVLERIVPRRQVRVYRLHDFLVALRAGHFQHLRVALEDALGPRAQAPGDDHASVVLERLADRIE